MYTNVLEVPFYLILNKTGFTFFMNPDTRTWVYLTQNMNPASKILLM
jgi:hypothetical protein